MLADYYLTTILVALCTKVLGFFLMDTRPVNIMDGHAPSIILQPNVFDWDKVDLDDKLKIFRGLCETDRATGQESICFW